MHNCNQENNTCVSQETVIENVVLAHAYVPFQYMCDTYSPLGSLSRGTIFPPLCGLYEHGMKGKCL